ncbi:MAG: hypothetical protein H6581_16305 [Bacteroidia bacterium]|nr:hypothetical protein [Bacteroidia bacterium]
MAIVFNKKSFVRSFFVGLLPFITIVFLGAGHLQAQRLFLTNSHLGKSQTVNYNFNGSSSTYTYEIRNLLNGEGRIKVERVGAAPEGGGVRLEENLPMSIQNGETKNLNFAVSYGEAKDQEVKFSLRIIPEGLTKSEAQNPANQYLIDFVFTARPRILFWDANAKHYVTQLPAIRLDYARRNKEQIVEIRRHGSNEDVELMYSIEGSGKKAFSVYSNEINSKKLAPGKPFRLHEGLVSLVIRYSPIGSPSGEINPARVTVYEKDAPESAVIVDLEGVANGARVGETDYAVTQKAPPVKEPEITAPNVDPKLLVPDIEAVTVVETPKDTSGNKTENENKKVVEDDFYGETGNRDENGEMVKLTKDEEIELLLDYLRYDTLRISVDTIDFKPHFGAKYWKFFGKQAALIELSNEVLTERNQYIGKLENVRFHPDRMYLYSGYDTILYGKKYYDFDPESGRLVLAIAADSTIDDTIRKNFNIGIHLKPVYKQGNRYLTLDSLVVPWRPVVSFSGVKKPFNKTPIYWTIGILIFLSILGLIRWLLTRAITKLSYLKEPQYLRHRSSRAGEIDRSIRVANEIEIDLNKGEHRLIQLKWPEVVLPLLTAEVPTPEESGFIRFLKKILFVKGFNFQAFYYSLRIEPIEEKLPSKLGLRDHDGLLLLETELTGDILATDHQDFLLTKNRFKMNIYIDPEEILAIHEAGTRTSDSTSLQIPFRIYEEPFWGFTRVEEFVVPLRIVLREPVR